MTAYEKAFSAAKEKLHLAKGKLECMKTARTSAELARLWSEFLTEQNRVFLRLKKATEHGAGKGWFDQIMHEQRNDELLCYLLHARNAAEHGLEHITEMRGGHVGIRGKGKSLHVKDLRLDFNSQGLRVTGDPETLNQLVFDVVPGTVNLIAVVDRSVIYHPPKNHLGKAIENPNPIVAAELTISYLEIKLGEAEANYLK